MTRKQTPSHQHATQINPMASYHCSVKVGGKGGAAKHAEYIEREGKYKGRKRYEDLEASDAGNMPEWAAHNPEHFWQAADTHERENGTTYREIEVALPRELNVDQRRELVEQFVAQEIGDRHAYQWAIHNPKAALEKGEQPHAHIMYSERRIDGHQRDPDQYFKRFNNKCPSRGGCQKDSAGTKERLQATRERWAHVQNRHLERHGHTVRVDHRSLEAQGIDRTPERHLGGAGVRALSEQDIGNLLERRAHEGEHERAQNAVSRTIDLSGDLQAARDARDRQIREREAAEKARAVEEKARAFAREASERFKLEQAARAFGREATASLKRQMEAEQKAEREAKLEVERAKQRQQELSERQRDRLPVTRTAPEPPRQRTLEHNLGPERDRVRERDYPGPSR